jgi:hypothetical protein
MDFARTPVALCAAVALLAGCATRAVDVLPAPADPAEFAAWGCDRIDDELDTVQQRAADTAYAVDERVGNNIVALGMGVMVFWPALLAMRADGPEAADLARLKGRFEALQTVARQRQCPAPSASLPLHRAQGLPVALGETLVYEDRTARRAPPTPWVLQVQALHRGDIAYRLAAAVPGELQHDFAGNVALAPAGELAWPRLLRSGLVLGQVTAGEIVRTGDPSARARMRGQVVAVGPQMLAGRHFDAAVVELFGDAALGDSSTRVAGVIVVDRTSGVLLRLDLRSAHPLFALQRRLVRVDTAAP